MTDVSIPEWVATTVGRLTLENEALRRNLDAAIAQLPGSEPDESAAVSPPPTPPST